MLSLFANTTHTMASGEITQLNNRHNLKITESDYFTVVKNKTASLFASAASAPALLNQQSKTIQSSLANFGLNLGIAFQMIDDILDYKKK